MRSERNPAEEDGGEYTEAGSNRDAASAMLSLIELNIQIICEEEMYACCQDELWPSKNEFKQTERLSHGEGNRIQCLESIPMYSAGSSGESNPIDIHGGLLTFLSGESGRCTLQQLCSWGYEPVLPVLIENTD